jgi:serine acetyltransferase
LLACYRVAHSTLYWPWLLRPLDLAYVALYKVIGELIVGTEIHWRCEIGPRARLYHGYGLVVHARARIGSDVVLRQGVTIGVKHTVDEVEAPVIGNSVDIGANALILGDTSVGDGALIGAGAVVVGDVPRDAVIPGDAARVVSAGHNPCGVQFQLAACAHRYRQGRRKKS